MTEKKKKDLVNAVITIVLGLLMIIYKERIMSWLLTAIGIIAIIEGIIELVKQRDVKKGWIEIGGGILIIILGWTLLSIILYIVGALLLIYGIYMLYNLVKNQTRATTRGANIGLYATPIVYMICGGMLCFAQKSMTETIVLIVGVLLVINGIMNIIKILK